MGQSQDTWGEKLNAALDIIDAVLFSSAKLDGSQVFTQIQEFHADGIKIGTFTIYTDATDLIIKSGSTVILRLTTAGVLTAKDIVADPVLV